MLLAAPQRYHQPFDYFTCDDALPAPLLKQLCASYDRPLNWQHHTDSFYRAYLCDVSELLDEGFCQALSARMAALVGMPLTSTVRATLQRMEAGQYALPHTDRPLPGYEAVRLVVQLNPGWEDGDGGLLCIHPDEQGAQTARTHPPRWNSAFGFAMGPRSFHSVQPTRAARRTVVLNLWHAANTEALAAWASAQFVGMRFDFGGALGALASEAEPCVPEEDSFRAGCVAHLLLRWGFSEAVACEGYRQGLSPLLAPRGAPAVLLARWVARLQQQDFDAGLWQRLASAMDGAAPDPRLAEGMRLAFP